MTSGCRPKASPAPRSSSRLSVPRQSAGAALARQHRVPPRQCAGGAEFRSEAARIDLNSAPKELLAGLFVGLGAPRPAADSYADRIIGWRSPPAPDDPERGRDLSRGRHRLRAARRPVPAHQRAWARVRHSGTFRRARAAVPDRLQRPAADQRARRRAAGARRAARNGPGTPQRGTCPAQMRRRRMPKASWRCSAPPKISRPYKATRRCG